MESFFSIVLASLLLSSPSYGAGTGTEAGANSEQNKRTDAGAGGGATYTGSGNFPGTEDRNQQSKKEMKKGRRADSGKTSAGDTKSNVRPDTSPSPTPRESY